MMYRSVRSRGSHSTPLTMKSSTWPQTFLWVGKPAPPQPTTPAEKISSVRLSRMFRSPPLLSVFLALQLHAVDDAHDGGVHRHLVLAQGKDEVAEIGRAHV